MKICFTLHLSAAASRPSRRALRWLLPCNTPHGDGFTPAKTLEVFTINMRNKLFPIALSGMLVFGAGALLAQDNSAPPPQQEQSGGMEHGRRGMDPDRQLQHMTRQLDLSADQQNQIRPILADRQQKMQALWQNQSLSRQDRRTQMQSIREDSKSKIEAVLNDQQKQKFDAMQEERGRHGGAWQGGGNQAPSTSQPQSQPQ
jgi:periplasmic protein CpxP/Spy